MVSDPYRYLAIGMCAVAMFGSATGLGKMFSNFFAGIARNPGAADKMSKYVYVAAGLIEAVGLFAWALAVLLFVAG